MKYNFDEIIDRRNTNAMNTDGFRSYIFHVGPEAVFPFKDEDFVRMWVADMEFAVAPEICQALLDRVNKRIFGYTQVYDSRYYDAFSKWCQDRYDWSFPRKELTFSTGVVPAIFQLIELLVKPGEKVLTLTPAYSQFQNGAKYSGVDLVCCPMKKENGAFVMDMEAFEKAAADPKMKLVMWCSPQNPTGRVWTREELSEVARIVEKYDLWIISDEIHCDLLRSGKTHIPMGKAMPDYKKLITCMAPSKAFNIAGLMLSDIIIRDQDLRERFNSRDKNVGCLNPLSIEAHIAAFQHGWEWLRQLQEYLDENFSFVGEYLSEHLPQAEYYIPEATYLAWVDLGKCLPDVEDIPMFFANEAGVLLEGGDDLFVGNAKGYVRLNLAMPRAIIAKGLKRICDAVHKHNACPDRKE